LAQDVLAGRRSVIQVARQIVREGGLDLPDDDPAWVALRLVADETEGLPVHIDDFKQWHVDSLDTKLAELGRAEEWAGTAASAALRQLAAGQYGAA
jgi:hypothetical protein